MCCLSFGRRDSLRSYFLYRLLAIALIAFFGGFVFVSASRAQAKAPPMYPGIVPAPPLFDQPLVAATGWPDTTWVVGFGGTWQMTLKPMRDCASFRLAFANSTVSESKYYTHQLVIRASLFIKRPKQAAIVRQVTFHHGDAEATMEPETLLVSDPIPEYWKGAENATAYIRTYAQTEYSGFAVPMRSDWKYLTGYPVKQVVSASAAPDLTMAAPDEPRFANAPDQANGFGPVAILGDADLTTPSVAVIGSSSVAYATSYAALALIKAKIPFVLLSASGTSAADYLGAKLRPQLDACCSHVLVQYGRNDIGWIYNGYPPAQEVLAPVEANLLHLWQRLKLQGAWVAQTTITPRSTGSSYSDPSTQTASPAEVPLRLPLNDWIRQQPFVANTPLGAFYEMADTVEYFQNGKRTSKWNYSLGAGGRHQAFTGDGLHPNDNGNTALSQKIKGTDFVYDATDFVSPTPADAFASSDGTRLIVTFNEAKNPPLIIPADVTGFSLMINNFPRAITGGYQSGPKEVTLYVGGATIQKDDILALGFAPQSGQEVTDSSPLRNPLNAFAGLTGINKSQGGAVVPNIPQISLSQVTLTRNGATIEAVVQLLNDGGAPATGSRLLKATLGGSATQIALPLSIGGLNPGGSVAFLLTWPAPDSGTKTALKISGSCDQSGFSSSVKVTIP